MYGRCEAHTSLSFTSHSQPTKGKYMTMFKYILKYSRWHSMAGLSLSLWDTFSPMSHTLSRLILYKNAFAACSQHVYTQHANTVIKCIYRAFVEWTLFFGWQRVHSVILLLSAFSLLLPLVRFSTLLIWMALVCRENSLSLVGASGCDCARHRSMWDVCVCECTRHR